MLKNILYCFIIVFTFYGCSSIDQAESLYRQGENEKALEMALNFLDNDDSKIRLRAVRLVGKGWR